MSVATCETQSLTMSGNSPVEPVELPVEVTENAARAVRDIVDRQRIQCLEQYAPDLVATYQSLKAEKGEAPTLQELAGSAGMTVQDLQAKFGAVAFAKKEQLPAEYREFARELSAANGRAPTSAELAARGGVSEEEFLAKLGSSATTILGKIYLRLRTVGAGCSGMEDKLDIDPEYKEARDSLFDFHGVPVIIDKRSLLYVAGAKVDYHNELNRSGFSITNPRRKTTCGCGSSYSM
jgi:iron-sulfur cluster assembly accessory protein